MNSRNFHFSLVFVLAFTTMQVSDACMGQLVSLMDVIDIGAAGTKANDPSLVAAGKVAQQTGDEAVADRMKKAIADKSLSGINSVINARPNEPTYRFTKVAMLIAAGSSSGSISQAKGEAIGAVEKTWGDTFSRELSLKTRTAYLKSLKSVMDTYAPATEEYKRVLKAYCGQAKSVSTSQSFLSELEADYLPGNSNAPKCP